VHSFLTQLKAQLEPQSSPYLRALHDGSLLREDFVETQVQFLFAVVYFSRPMATLAARLPRPEQRLALLGNVWDEHGRGEMASSHERSFLSLLERLGTRAEDVERRALWPEVRAFNTALAGACALDDVPTALALLGIIEDLFSGISADVGRGIVSRGWLPAEALVHYPLHQEVDVAHAEGFYRLLEPLHAAGGQSAYQVEQGLQLGGYLFLRLYEDLYRARARRSWRQGTGPHSLADGWFLPR
jgi:pyrroloquinoline quinone (PQQ) biosynthesis protein C